MFEDIDIKFKKINVVEISWLPCVWIHCLLRVQQCSDESKSTTTKKWFSRLICIDTDFFASLNGYTDLPLIFYLLVDCVSVAWENSRDSATLPLVSPPKDVWETSAEIPYWWRVTTQIWVVLLIGWNKFPTRATNQKLYSDLASDASSVWIFCARFSDVIWRGNQW